jgi:hypothetical protein
VLPVALAMVRDLFVKDIPKAFVIDACSRTAYASFLQ